MSEMKVLLLGWESTPTVKEDQNNAWMSMSKALGDQMNLSMILPVSDPDFILKNVALTGLNNVDLPAIEPVKPQKDFQPFSEQPIVQKQIPLYGAPVLQADKEYSTQLGKAEQAASAGVMQQNRGNAGHQQTAENQNFFGQSNLDQVSLDVQVIQFARWATRLAAQRQYDVIYAYDWRTFLAGSELKLVTGKPLVLRVAALSQDAENATSAGWMYQIEVQSLQKADWIIAETNQLAALLEEKYEISPEVITSLESQAPESDSAAEEISGAAAEVVAEAAGEPVGAISPEESGKSAGKKASTRKKSPVPAAPKESRKKSAEKVRDILKNVVA